MECIHIARSGLYALYDNYEATHANTTQHIHHALWLAVNARDAGGESRELIRTCGGVRRKRETRVASAPPLIIPHHMRMLVVTVCCSFLCSVVIVVCADAAKWKTYLHRHSNNKAHHTRE